MTQYIEEKNKIIKDTMFKINVIMAVFALSVTVTKVGP